jgi:hypothetical protein
MSILYRDIKTIHAQILIIKQILLNSPTLLTKVFQQHASTTYGSLKIVK